MSLRPLRAALDGWKPAPNLALDPLHAIAAAWPAIAGADVAAHSQPVALAGKVLVIVTRSSAWSQQLQLLSLTILAGMRACRIGVNVERLSFRVGRLRQSVRRDGVPAPRAQRQGAAPVSEPAADLAEAYQRLQRRFIALQRMRKATCPSCAAPLDADLPARRCAPCTVARERDRTVSIERLLYAVPWLSWSELRELLPDLGMTEYERVRRRLLARWWVVLERARAIGRLGNSLLERQIASSYVLLQSRLLPAQITPPVVQNLLGTELARLLFGEARKEEAQAALSTTFVEKDLR